MDSISPHCASSSCVLYHSYICDYTTVLKLHDSYICDYGLSTSCVENVILFDNNRQCVAASNKQHFATTCRYSPVGMQKMYLLFPVAI